MQYYIGGNWLSPARVARLRLQISRANTWGIPRDCRPLFTLSIDNADVVNNHVIIWRWSFPPYGRHMLMIRDNGQWFAYVNGEIVAQGTI